MLSIRQEKDSDLESIRNIHIEAFKNHPYSRQTEHKIVDALREAGAMTLSLVAENEDGDVVGHIAFSAAKVGGMFSDFYMLGPIGVLPKHQNQGIGSLLVREGLAEMSKLGAVGIILVGNPKFYTRFGFANDAGLFMKNVPAEYFMVYRFKPIDAKGEVEHHAAFGVE